MMALSHLGKKTPYDCGSAGTVLRFLALRVSRIPGRHILKGTKRLFSRPQDDLKKILSQLSIKIEFYTDHLVIEGDGWKPKNKSLKISRDVSSQFVSGVLLNAWNLDFPLSIQWDEIGVSEGYWQMSLQVVTDFGMEPIQNNLGIIIPAHSKVKINKYNVESDVSSAFAVAAFAALNGEATFRQFPFRTLQPDIAFVDILEKMGIGLEKGADYLRIFKSSKISGVHWKLNNCPDLFPVLATLCAFAKTPSRLDGAPQLAYKESNRVQKLAELLQKIDVKNQALPDGMVISPPQSLPFVQTEFNYDTDHDHRLAFAATLVASQKYPIQILHPEVVNKSFPEFWQLLINNSDQDMVPSLKKYL